MAARCWAAEPQLARAPALKAPPTASQCRSAAPKASSQASGCACGCSSPPGPPCAAACWAARPPRQVAREGCCSAAQPAALQAPAATFRCPRRLQLPRLALLRRQATMEMGTRAVARRPCTARPQPRLAARWMHTCMARMLWTAALVRAGCLAAWLLENRVVDKWLRGAFFFRAAATKAGLPRVHSRQPCCPAASPCLPTEPFPLERSRFASR